MIRKSKLAKLSRPRLSQPLLRERLFAELDRLCERPVIAVTGPPGAGKTTLVASYIEARDLPGVWYAAVLSGPALAGHGSRPSTTSRWDIAEVGCRHVPLDGLLGTSGATFAALSAQGQPDRILISAAADPPGPAAAAQEPTRMRLRTLLLVGLLLLPAAAHAESYPGRPIRLIASVPPGIGSDRYARLLAQKLGESLKQPVVVENRPGAGGMIAADLVAKAPADGYTLLWGQNALFGTAPHVLKSNPLDVIQAFVPVAGNAISYPFLYASVAFPIKSFADLVALAKQRPGALNYGSLGVGSGPHIAMELLKHQTGIDMEHVPYKGSAELLRALVAGEIAVAFDYYMPLMAQVRSGRMKVIGYGGRSRSAAAPEVRTLDEQGLKGFEYFGWSGIFVRTGTPPAMVDLLNREIAKARATPEVEKLYREAGSIELKGSPAEFAAFVRSEYERGRTLVRISGATID